MCLKHQTLIKLRYESELLSPLTAFNQLYLRKWFRCVYEHIKKTNKQTVCKWLAMFTVALMWSHSIPVRNGIYPAQRSQFYIYYAMYCTCMSISL